MMAPPLLKLSREQGEEREQENPQSSDFATAEIQARWENAIS
jgi:hypothetical protein